VVLAATSGGAGLMFGSWGVLAAAGFAIPVGFLLRSWHEQRLQSIIKVVDNSITDPLLTTMYTAHKGALGQLEMALHSQQARMQTCLTRMLDNATNLSLQAREASQLAHRSHDGIN
jgi:aerotaxis receptor